MGDDHWIDAALVSDLISPKIAAKVVIEMGKQAARIRELEAELVNEKARAKLSDLLDALSATRVIVPVEPTTSMIVDGWVAFKDSESIKNQNCMEAAYRAMIQAAQEQPK